MYSEEAVVEAKINCTLQKERLCMFYRKSGNFRVKKFSCDNFSC